MATHTRAELPVVFDCSLGEDRLAEFEPETERAPLRLRAGHPSSAVNAGREELFATPPQTRMWPLAVPIVLATAIAGAAVSWIGLRTSEDHLAATPRSVAANDILLSEPAPTLSAQIASAQIAPAGIAPAAADTQAPASAVDPSFERTLAMVSASYRSLDAGALTSVWPGADTASLSRAFAELKYQALSFDRCTVRPNGPSAAVASCEVSLAMASKTGDASLQRRRESWTLVLDRSGERWTIAGLSVR